jgi:hypothetical protein
MFNLTFAVGPFTLEMNLQALVKQGDLLIRSAQSKASQTMLEYVQKLREQVCMRLLKICAGETKLLLFKNVHFTYLQFIVFNLSVYHYLFVDPI